MTRDAAARIEPRAVLDVGLLVLPNGPRLRVRRSDRGGRERAEPGRDARPRIDAHVRSKTNVAVAPAPAAGPAPVVVTLRVLPSAETSFRIVATAVPLTLTSVL